MTPRSRSCLPRVVGVLVLAVWVAGCATHVKPLAPELFPAPKAAIDRDATAIELEVADRDQTFRTSRLHDLLVEVEMPIGRIVEAAGRLAPAEQFDALPDTAGPDPRRLRLRVDDVTGDAVSRFVYFIPGPLPLGRTDVTTRLSFSATLLGPGGAVLWSQRYDSGMELLKLRRNGLVMEPVPDGVQRQTHGQAVRLMRQAALDVRAWLAQERRRDRVI